MLSDVELEQASKQLPDLRHEAEHQHATFTEVLGKYHALLQDYTRLKSDYEEERDARERYKQLSRSQVRDPFVLVLVDGHGYFFPDELISKRAEGGQQAAELLDNAIRSSLRTRGLERRRVVVRICADVAALSRSLCSAKLVGAEKRSFAPFVAAFTGRHELFDFIDTGEGKDSARLKIRAQIQHYASDPQCAHIYFAGCHDATYIKTLTLHVSDSTRMTLLRTDTFHPQYEVLPVEVAEFADVFHSASVDGQDWSSRRTSLTPQSSAYEERPSSRVCPYFLKGTCKFGKGCPDLHERVATNGRSTPSSASTVDERPLATAKFGFTVEQMAEAISFSATATRGGAKSRGQRRALSNGASHDPTNSSALVRYDSKRKEDFEQSDPDFAAMLPTAKSIPGGHVAVNEANHRLDPRLPPVSPVTQAAFYARHYKQKLCNHYHLSNHCPPSDNCPYDHKPSTQRERDCLLTLARSMVCPNGGGCRTPTCHKGHICQSARCKYRGGSASCRLPARCHQEDLRIARTVPGATTGVRSGAVSRAGATSKASAKPFNPNWPLPYAPDDPEDDHAAETPNSAWWSAEDAVANGTESGQTVDGGAENKDLDAPKEWTETSNGDFTHGRVETEDEQEDNETVSDLLLDFNGLD